MFFFLNSLKTKWRNAVLFFFTFLNSYDKKMEDLEDATQKELEKMQADFDKQLAANEAEVKRYERIGKN